LRECCRKIKTDAEDLQKISYIPSWDAASTVPYYWQLQGWWYGTVRGSTGSSIIDLRGRIEHATDATNQPKGTAYNNQ
jgi:hypothetical protein